MSTRHLTVFARDRVAAQVALEGSAANENWLVSELLRYLMQHETAMTFEHNTFKPKEYQTGKPGGPASLDITGCRRGDNLQEGASHLCELKLMKEPNAKWGKLILTDIFRVACARDRTTAFTRRYMLVVGRESLWTSALEQNNGLLKRTVPSLTHVLNPLTLGITYMARTTTLSATVRPKYEECLEPYLHPLLPKRIKVQNVGLARVHADPDMEKDVFTARMWRIFPRW